MQGGQGRGQGHGMGQGRGSGGGGGGGYRLGPDGECVCLKCGYRTPHQRGTPCYNLSCPKCGASMTRAM